MWPFHAKSQRAYSDNGLSWSPILSCHCDLRDPLPGGFPACLVERLSAGVSSLWDLHQAVRVPVNASLCSIVSEIISSPACFGK